MKTYRQIKYTDTDLEVTSVLADEKDSKISILYKDDDKALSLTIDETLSLIKMLEAALFELRGY